MRLSFASGRHRNDGAWWCRITFIDTTLLRGRPCVDPPPRNLNHWSWQSLEHGRAWHWTIHRYGWWPG